MTHIYLNKTFTFNVFIQNGLKEFILAFKFYCTGIWSIFMENFILPKDETRKLMTILNIGEKNYFLIRKKNTLFNRGKYIPYLY